jgi:hypothetical protein
MNLHELVMTRGREAAREMVPARDRHLIDLAAEVLGDEAQELGFSYSGFAMVALPHRKPEGDGSVWTRRNGRFTLLVEPGSLLTPGGGVRSYGVPYGARARLILLYLQSEAIRRGSPVVQLGSSLHAWLGRMGVPVGGTSYAAIREQANRISACRLTVGWTADDGRQGFERANIVKAMLFVPPAGDERQGHLWDETAQLSPEFYAALQAHPVPISETAIRLIQNSSAVMDVYVWLAYRLHAITKPTTISWPVLHQQFGSEYRLLKKFRERFTENLREAIAVYPGAKIEVDPRGVTLRPSPPAVTGRTPRLISI